MRDKLTSVHNPLVIHLSRLARQRKCREEEQSCIVEGLKTLFEIDPSLLRTLIVTENMSTHPIPFCEKTFVVSEEVFRKISLTKEPEGILAEVALPKEQDLSSCTKLVVLDRLQDPGNVGTIFRTALAFGWNGIILLEGSCDPFNDKALRAAKGATFKIPHLQMSEEAFLQWAYEQKFTLFAAHLNGVFMEQQDPSPKEALIFGSEGQGVSDTLLKQSKKVTIPTSGDIESLNVAISAGILLYYLSRKIN